MVKKSFSVLGKQQDTLIMKFDSHPYTLWFQYPIFSKFLSFHMSLVVVLHFGAGDALQGIEISQALTTPGKIRLPIGQPAGKFQVAPIKSQVAPLLPNVIMDNTV